MLETAISKRRAAGLLLASALLASAALADGGSAAVLTLDASVQQERFLVGEPVLVELTLTNTGPGDASVWSDVTPNTEAVACGVRGPDGATRTFKPADRRDPSGRRTLVPGATLTSLVDLRLLRLQWPEASLMFATPGHYEIRCSYDAFLPPGIERPAPAVLQLDVASPGNTLGAAVFARADVGYFLEGMPDDDARAALREIADGSADDPFRVYARYYLGVRCLDDRTQGGDVPARCLDELRQAATVDFQLRDLALLRLARADKRSGRYDEARNEARQALELSGRLTVRNAAAALMEEMTRTPPPSAAAPGTTTAPATAGRGPDPADERRYAALIEDYLGALERGDFRACRSMLSRRFLYQGNFDRDWFIAKLEQDRAETAVRAAGVSLRATDTSYSLEGPDATPVVEFDLHADVPGAAARGSSRIRLELESSGRRLRIARWDRVAGP